ncbi:TonB family protein [Roseovarius nitratireducens]|uniref:TonB family protein n=1 Tax=Roseovarius nitratireducens TaxID=2044597 RepID=UPI000CE2663D|nr:TonB family protein [Roseovarius nitratireducens]
MIRGLEFAGFVALAAAVHAGLWTAAPEGGGAGGETGTDTATLAASTPQMAALVETWQRPVAVQDAAPAPRPAPAPDTQPVALRPEAGHAAPPTPDALPDTTRAPHRPQVESAPLPLPVPRVETRAPSASQPPEAPQEAAPTPPNRPVPTPRPATPDAPRAPAMAALPQVDRSPPAVQAPPPPDTRPRARPATPAPARREEVARGTGGAQAGGQAQTATPARIDNATRASLMGQWGGTIRSRIERHKRYPSGTRASGTAHLVLDVAADGQLLGVGLRRSSGDARLDAAAVRAVRRARLPAAPDHLPGARHRFNLPVAFTR